MTDEDLPKMEKFTIGGESGPWRLESMEQEIENYKKNPELLAEKYPDPKLRRIYYNVLRFHHVRRSTIDELEYLAAPILCKKVNPGGHQFELQMEMGSWSLTLEQWERYDKYETKLGDEGEPPREMSRVARCKFCGCSPGDRRAKQLMELTVQFDVVPEETKDGAQ
jgi:hypothetical protein